MYSLEMLIDEAVLTYTTKNVLSKNKKKISKILKRNRCILNRYVCVMKKKETIKCRYIKYNLFKCFLPQLVYLKKLIVTCVHEFISPTAHAYSTLI